MVEDSGTQSTGKTVFSKREYTINIFCSEDLTLKQSSNNANFLCLPSPYYICFYTVYATN